MDRAIRRTQSESIASIIIEHLRPLTVYHNPSLSERLRIMSKVDKKALADESYQKTLTRLENIKKHFRDGQGSGKLKDKVCVITGVGSLKGIGCVFA